MSAGQDLDGEVTREQVMEALRALRKDIDDTMVATADLVRRNEALERRVARQEQQRATEARGGVR